MRRIRKERHYWVLVMPPFEHDFNRTPVRVRYPSWGTAMSAASALTRTRP